MEFLDVDTVDSAREKLLSSVISWMAVTEALPIGDAGGRILAEDIYARQDIPHFRRSTVDGYALQSANTAAAGESIPVLLTEKSKVEMGKPAQISLSSGECAEVPTGGMIPDGADAVVMVEYTEVYGSDGIAVYASVAVGENVVQIGEDARAGDLLLRKGRRILPQDIGALAAAGITAIKVIRPPRLTILSTGDELVPIQQDPAPGQIRDVNTFALAELARKSGFHVISAGVLPDDESALEGALRTAMKAGDIVIVSGGSSQGQKDITRELIDKVSSPGVYTHGIAIKPGKPTILGYDDASKTLLVGLPGHPVSAMMVFELLLGWLICEISACSPSPAVPARLARNVASSPGRLTCWPVSLEWTGSEYIADPIYGKSGLITTLTKAKGYFIVDRDTEGLSSGQIILVHLF
ncbi:MAG: molybdopterin-binding protein [Clostridiales bacterium]|nr:molybdopterin-binding protein [Clostridiales bacterium]